MTPVGEHELKVPVGEGVVVERRLATASPSVFASSSFRFHTVRRGETLLSIARKYKTTTTKLAAANEIKRTSRLRTGTMLMVPIAPAAVAVRAARGVKASGLTASARGTASYRVKRGDTLSRIAHLFDTSVEALKSLNRLSSDSIAIGDRLTVR